MDARESDERSVEKSNLQQILWKAIDRLPVIQGVVILLYYMIIFVVIIVFLFYSVLDKVLIRRLF